MKKYESGKVDLTKATISEKYDGISATWDGEILTSREGLDFGAPASFTRTLPSADELADHDVSEIKGELWCGRGGFESVMSTVKSADKSRWNEITYMIWEAPESLPLAAAHATMIDRWTISNEIELEQALNECIQDGGEGLVIRDSDGVDWKHKLKYTADGRVVDYNHVASDPLKPIASLLVRDRDGNKIKVRLAKPSDKKNPPALGATIEFGYYAVTGTGKPSNCALEKVRYETALHLETLNELNATPEAIAHRTAEVAIAEAAVSIHMDHDCWPDLKKMTDLATYSEEKRKVYFETVKDAEKCVQIIKRSSNSTLRFIGGALASKLRGEW